MAGLLYKDFVAIRGKRLVLILLLMTIVYILLRIIFPGTREIPDFILVNDDDEVINIVDTFFFMGEFLIIYMGCYLINTLVSKIIQYDEKDKIIGYLFSMPIKKDIYIASKFIFIGITSYVIFSIYEVWHIVSLSSMSEGYNMDLSYLVAGFAIPFLCFMLFISSIELSMFLIMGRGKTMMIKVGIAMFIGILILGYFLFGDLKVIENWDLGNLINWMDAHEIFLTLISIISPIITLAFSYVSYLICVLFYERRQLSDE